MGKKEVHHPDLEAILMTNKAVVGLSGEPHGYSPADELKLSGLARDLESRADNQEFEEAVADKASFLIFRLASGQYFKAGNKRTSLIAGLVFLVKNGYKANIEDPALVSEVDKAGVGSAGLDDVYSAMKQSMSKSKVERKKWEGAIQAIVDDHRAFLASLAS